MRKRPLLLMACAFVAGICFGVYQSGWAFPAFGILVLYGCAGMFGRKQWGWLAARGAVLVILFFLGAAQGKSQLDIRDQELSQLKDGDWIILSGELYKKEYKSNFYIYYLTACKFKNGTGEISCNRVLCYSEADSCFIGESLTVQGQVNMFSRARNEGNFDQQSFYQSQKIDFSLKNIRVIERDGRKNSVGEGLFDLRRELSAVYRQNLSPANAGVLSAMLLGEKAELDQEVKAEYQSAGISHILAISGLHVSLLGMGLYRFLRKRGLPFLGAFLWAGSFLFLYAGMTGESVSTRRAVGMLIIAMLGEVIGRSYDSLSALGALVILLLWENPFLLEYAGFVFSVVAVVGITVTAGLLQDYGFQGGEQRGGMQRNRELQDRGQQSEELRGRKMSWDNLQRKWKQMFWGSLGVWLTTAPLSAFYYYEVPTYSVFLNLAVLPLLKVLFVFGIAGAVVGNVLPGLGKIILFPCEKILNFYGGLADFSLQLPGSVCIVGKPSVGKLLCYYVFLALLCGWCHRRKQSQEEKENPDKGCRSMKGFCIGRWLGIGLLIVVFSWPAPREFEVSVLDVGQGDGIFICTKEGVAIFIDGGSTDVKEVGKYRILPFLKSKGITHISYWFVSHGDKDHISGLLEIMGEGYRIDNLVVAAAAYAQAGMAESQEDGLSTEEEIKKTAYEHGINIIEMEALDKLCFGETVLTCLSPDRKCADWDRNDLSLVLHYEDSRFSGLFTGDISEKAERRLVEEGVCEKVLFYKAAHHGSRYSNSEEFLQLLSPQIGLVSCGLRNNYGHPSGEALTHMEEAGAEVFRTDQGGQIKVKMLHNQLHVSMIRTE